MVKQPRETVVSMNRFTSTPFEKFVTSLCFTDEERKEIPAVLPVLVFKILENFHIMMCESQPPKW